MKQTNKNHHMLTYKASKHLKSFLLLLFSEQDIAKPEKTVSHTKPGITQVVSVLPNCFSLFQFQQDEELNV